MTAPGGYDLTIKAEDSQNRVAFADYHIDVFGLTTPQLVDAHAGSNYSFQLLTAGGTAPVRFDYDAYLAPDWISVDQNGLVTGLPSASDVGDFSFGISITDAEGATCGGTVTGKVECGIVTISPSTLPIGLKNVPYTTTLAAAGGFAPYTFAWTGGGTLPSGITVHGDGTVSGTPTNTGTFTFGVRVSDNGGCIKEQTESLTIAEVGSAPVSYTESCQNDNSKSVTVNVPANQFTSSVPGFPQGNLDAQAKAYAINQAAAQLAALGCGCYLSNMTVANDNTYAQNNLQRATSTCPLTVVPCLGANMTWPNGQMTLLANTPFDYWGQHWGGVGRPPSQGTYDFWNSNHTVLLFSIYYNGM